MAKILIIGDPRSPHDQSRGLIGHRAGHQIYWFSSSEINLPNVVGYSIPNFGQGNMIARNVYKLIYLNKTLRQVQPDIVHVHYAQTELMVLALMNFHPLVVTIKGGDILPDQGYRGLSALSVRLLLEHADCITSKSEYLDRALINIDDYREKIRRITWGLDLNQFHPNRNVSALRKRHNIPTDDLVFFDPRLATPFYNKHVILKAFSNYMREGSKSATLLVAELFADPKYQNRLNQQARTLGISEKVRFVGAITYNEMPDYYAAADITISVPPSDGFPQTIYEAFACGSFLVLSDLPQYSREVEDKITVRLVPVGDEQALTKALIWAVSVPKIRERAKRKGIQYVKEHADFNVQAKLMNQVYNELLLIDKNSKEIE